MRIKVVIPCRNEVQFIEECIDAIYSSELDPKIDLSVFVVDGQSDDGTQNVIVKLQEKYRTLFLVENEKKLTPFAFNLGIRSGGGADFIQIVGARHILSRNYLLRSMNRLIENPDIWCVGGAIRNVYTNNTSRIISSAMGTTFGMGLGNFRTLKKSGFTDTVTSPMYPNSVFDRIGFFDEDLIRNQDDDFNFRVSQAGGKIYFDSEIDLKYYVRSNFKGLWRQFYQYGYWKVFVNRKHKTITTLRQLVPPLFVVYLFLLPFLLILGVSKLLVGASPLAVYFALSVYYSLKVSKSSSDFFASIKAYLYIHISYGLGYCAGIFQFSILNKLPAESQKRLSR